LVVHEDLIVGAPGYIVVVGFLKLRNILEIIKPVDLTPLLSPMNYA